MSSEAKNLKSIYDAIESHNATCDGAILEIQLNPFELDRIGWQEIRGILLVGNPDLPTGRFKVICDKDNPADLSWEVKEPETVEIKYV